MCGPAAVWHCSTFGRQAISRLHDDGPQRSGFVPWLKAVLLTCCDAASSTFCCSFAARSA